MADVRAAWNETGDKLSELGRKLKVHYDEQHGSEGQQTREELAEAARRLGGAVQDAFEALGTAARDKSVQDDVKQVGQSLAEALGATLGQATDELKRAFSERKGPASTVATPAATEAASATVVGGPATVVSEPEADGAPEADGTPGDGEGGTPPKVEPWGTP
ncbi:MAG: hypothetical protein QG622_167 [Actinomycetota bacterium]|nr:hypothetical protein [Actinomycetota bacterium]